MTKPLTKNHPLKRKNPKHFKNNLLKLTIIFSIISSFFLVSIIGKRIKPSITRYSKAEAKRLATLIINYATNETIEKKLDNNYLFTMTKNKDNEIETIDFNTKNVNKLLELVTSNIQDKLLDLEEGNIKDLKLNKSLKGNNFKEIKNGVVCEIPAGSLFGNTLLSNTGPLIPIKFSFIGQVTTNITTNIKEYGVNNVYLEINIHIEVTERITMPIFTEEVKTENNIPIALKVIQGKIPNYYGGIIEKNSASYTLPTT